ncbi:MAG: ATP synthase subunit I [Actinomycetota bacterium]
MDAIPAVEREIAIDIVRRGLLVAPAIVLVAGLVRGTDGALGAAVGLGIVLLNFFVSAYAIGRVVGTSPKMIGIVALASYVLRLATIVVALLALRNVDAIDFPALGFTLAGSHLALLVWEAPHVSMSLGAPGLRPSRPAPTTGEQ